MLNKYYNMTDASEVYRIAMGTCLFFEFTEGCLLSCLSVLHLRHKLAYFKAAEWEPAWIETARDIVRDEFKQSYKNKKASEEASDEEVVEADKPSAVRYLAIFVVHTLNSSCTQQVSSNTFDNLESLCAPKPLDLRDDLDAYLSTDPEAVGDVLKWWSEKSTMYPSLSRMALDYLSIPGMLYYMMSIIYRS